MNSGTLIGKILGSTRAFLLFVFLILSFLGSGIGVAWFLASRVDDKPTVIPATPNLSLTNVDTPGASATQKLTVNSNLEVKGQFYLAPSAAPQNAKAGTLYFDQSTNTLRYYDGQAFVPVASQDAVPQATVSSLQGQTGAITLTPGNGITINGTTIASSGILGVNGVGGTINVTTANGIASLSLPQNIAPSATPTFAGLTLTAPLPVSSGGTGSTNFPINRLLLGNGTDPLSFVADAASPGLCLISNNGAGPSFQACPGGVGGASVSASPNGTVNAIAKFTAGTVIGDSNISDNGSIVDIGLPLTVNGSVTTSALVSTASLNITPGAALTIGAINQDFTLRGSSNSVITGRSGSFTTTLGFTTPTSNNTINLPNEGGTVCLQNSPNCGFSTSGSGVSSVNSLTGAVSITGTPNQLIVTNGAGIALSLPQDIGTASSPQFGGLNVTGNLTLANASVLNVNTITQTAAGQPITVNAGVDGITFNANGRSFILPTTGGVNQTICTTGVSCVAGGGQAVLLAPGSAQADNTTDVSLFIDKTNATGNLVQLQRSGSDVFRVNNNGSLNTNTVAPISGAFTLGSTSNDFVLQGTTASEFRVGASLVFRFDGSTAAGTYNICTTAGNCSGLTGAVTTPGGTTGAIPKFTGGQVIGDSTLSESGTVLTATGSLVLQGAAGLTLGTSSSANGQVVFRNSTNANTVTLQSGATAAPGLTFTLPTAAGGAGQCIKSDGSGVLSFGDCLTGSGGGGGVTALNGISGSVTLQGTANQVTVSGTGPIILGTPQDIGTASDVSFRTLTLSGTAGAGLSVGSIGSAGRIVLSDGDATPQNITFVSATQGGDKTITIPNFTGSSATLPVTASGFIQITAAGNIQTTGVLDVASGGTGGSTQATARSGIGAAASGANSDITSTSLLNTITPNGSFTLGATTQSFTLQGNASSTITASGGGFATSVGFSGTPSGAVTYNFDRSAAAGTYTICTTTGNCLGGGAGGANVTLSNLGSVALNSSLIPGTANTIDLGSAALPFRDLYIGSAATNNFRINGTASQARTITLSDTGGTIALLGPTAQQSGNLNISGTITSGAINSQTISTSANFTGTLNVVGATTIQSSGGLTLGASSSANGQIVLRNSSNANTVTLQSGVTSTSYALTLPTATGAANQCLKISSSGAPQLVWDNCLGGSGASGGDVLQNGNSFGGTMTIGTNDVQNLAFETGGTTRLSINSSGSIVELQQDTIVRTGSSGATGYGLTVQGGYGFTNGGNLSLTGGGVNDSTSGNGGSVFISGGGGDANPGSVYINGGCSGEFCNSYGDIYIYI
jgi:hypothetical protein